ncbi:ABC1 kinase family protein [Moorella sp. Hama-1]|uniref:ABC1 kinase family protein n=1 Tax=Moorella sp. Hama-1 TaxID=2138101 RepID=UPI000D64FD1B|nr:AarF/ABC1/UbiB kinase family protein [Moorella sp. Hama-1]BCV20154.1 2-octaprenylphenol hydroxylase [Moorella sp. Hama-1]
MSLRRRYIHFNRYRQVVNVLARYGFGYFLDQVGLGNLILRRTREEAPLSLGQRLRLALEELGSTFIKLGQLLSTRPDLLPADIVAELARLQDRVPPFPFPQVRQAVEEELGQPLEELFTTFTPEPLAVASIGQVHRATLPDGSQVIVKVQRPGIAKQVRIDLEILFDLARLAQRHTPYGQIYDFKQMAAEFAWAMTAELDYTQEGRNADRFRENFANDASVYFPAVYWDYTTERVLTQEYVEAVKLNDLAEIDRQGYNRRRIAVSLARAVYRQVLVDGFFHGDPHPGNLAVLPGEVIVFMDFGLVGTLGEEMQEKFVTLILAIIRRRSQDVLRAITAMGVVPAEADRGALRREIEDLRDKYYHLSFRQISLGQAIEELLQLAFRYRLHLPPELTLLGKTMLTLEGLVRELDPELELAELAEPYGRELLRRRFSARSLGRELVENLTFSWETLQSLPRQLRHLMDVAERGELTLRVEPLKLRGLIRQLDRISNKLTMSVVLLAFSIIMASLIISTALGAPANSLFFRLPTLEIGFGAAGLMLLWLLVTIWRSDRD